MQAMLVKKTFAKNVSPLRVFRISIFFKIRKVFEVKFVVEKLSLMIKRLVYIPVESTSFNMSRLTKSSKPSVQNDYKNHTVN